MRKITTLAFICALSACGGGGGGAGASLGSPNNGGSTPSVPTEINVAQAFKTFITSERTTSSIKSLGTDGGTATLILRTEEAYPFVTNGVSQSTASSKVVQFQRIGSDGKLAFQYIWKFHFDAQLQPIGLAIGDQFARWNGCLSVATKTTLPAMSGGTGVFFTGVNSSNYREEFRGGTYAHYCDPTLQTSSAVEWAVLKSDSILFMCTIFPTLFTAPKTRVCQQSDPTGALGVSIWITVFDTQNKPLAEYKS